MRRKIIVSAMVAVCAVLLLAAGAVLLPGRDGKADPSQGLGSAGDSRDPVMAGVARAQARLRKAPGNWDLWATLGAGYVQVARITADPTYYPKAEAALRRSLVLHARDNVAAMTGMGQLAAARHDFAAALSWGRQAQAIDPYSSVAYGVIADASTQLGDYAGATAALQRMLNLKPGVSSFTRASYDQEIHGATGPARNALNRALSDALGPSDIAFCRYYLGELAFNSGDVQQAATQFTQGLQADPTNTQLLAGRAKVEGVLGQQQAAIADYTTVTSRVPLPQYVVEFGDYLASIGRHREASVQYSLLQTEQTLFAANGVMDDLLSAEFDADHGSAASALRHARVEWNRRHSVLVADALAWALHVNGQHVEALRYAQMANRLGWRNASFRYHRGMIELSLGQRAAARADLSAALGINPNFSFLQAPIARRALGALGGPA